MSVRAAQLLRQLGVFPLDVPLELVATMFAVGAMRTLVQRLTTAFQCHVSHEVLASVVAPLAVGAAVALLRLVLRERQRTGPSLDVLLGEGGDAHQGRGRGRRRRRGG